MPPETWQGAELSRSAVKRRQRRRRQRRRRAGTLPPPPQLPSDAAKPPGESLQTSSGRSEDAGCPSGVGRVGRHWGGGRSLSAGAEPAAATFPAALLPHPRGAPGRGRRPWRALGLRTRSGMEGSVRVVGNLPPPSLWGLHPLPITAARTNDSSRLCRGGAVAAPRTRRRRLRLLQILFGTAETFDRVLRGAKRERRNPGAGPPVPTRLPAASWPRFLFPAGSGGDFREVTRPTQGNFLQTHNAPPGAGSRPGSGTGWWATRWSKLPVGLNFIFPSRTCVKG